MTAKSHMNIVLSVSCTYHKNKIRANVETQFPIIPVDNVYYVLHTGTTATQTLR